MKKYDFWNIIINMADNENEIEDVKANEDNFAENSENSFSDEKKVKNKESNNENIISTSNELSGLSEEIIREKTESALAKDPKKKKKSIITSVLLLLINIIFMIFIVKNLLKDINGDAFSIFFAQGKKLWWLAVGIFAYVLYVVVQVISYKLLIKSLAKKDSWSASYDVSLVGKYYDNVTPFAIGGQPMQIATLITRGFSPAVSTGIPLIKMVINTGMTAFLSLIFFVCGLPLIGVSSPLNKILMILLEVFGVVGLIITVLITLLIFILSSGKLITESFISWILRLGYKLKLVKNYRKTFRKVSNQVQEYKFSINYLLSNKKLLFEMVSFSLIENIIYAMMPFFVVMAFSTEVSTSIFITIISCIAKYFLCSMASCFIPLPGGTGMMEISFIILFGMNVGDKIVWALLAWRFLSYYIIIIHGFVHELIKIFRNISKNRKKNKEDVKLDGENEKGEEIVLETNK